MRATLLVFLAASAAILWGAITAVPSPSILLLSVGIDQYQTAAGFPMLTGAVNDARALNTALQDAGMKPENARLLTDEAATKANIEAAFEQMAKAASSSDTVVFFFSGYGGITPFAPDFMLLPIDAKAPIPPAKSGEGGITALELKTWLSKLNASNLLLILDTGMGGSQQVRAMRQIGMELAGQQDALRSLSNRNYTFLFLDGIAYEEHGHGLFTTALVDAIKEQSSRSGGVTAWSLAAAAGGKYANYLKGRAEGGAVQTLALGRDFRIGGKPAAAVASGPSRGVKTPGPNPSNVVASLEKGKSYALLVATDHYDDKRWPELSNPIHDTEAVAMELQQHYGYEKPELLLDPSMDALAATLGRYLDQSFAANDSLLIFSLAMARITKT